MQASAIQQSIQKNNQRYSVLLLGYSFDMGTQKHTDFEYYKLIKLPTIENFVA